MLFAASSTLTSRLPQRYALRLLRILSCAGLLATTAVAAPALADWQQPPSSTIFETPYGTLSVQASEYIYESKLYLGEAPVRPAIQGLLDITYAYEVADAHAALVAVSDGNAQCPIHYRWVVLNRSGYHISPPVGSCSKLIKVSAEGMLLTLTTPNAQDAGKVDIYGYDGKRIRKRTRAATPAEASRKINE